MQCHMNPSMNYKLRTVIHNNNDKWNQIKYISTTHAWLVVYYFVCILTTSQVGQPIYVRCTLRAFIRLTIRTIRSSTKKKKNQTNKFSYRSFCSRSLAHTFCSVGSVFVWICLCLMLFAYSSWCTMYTQANNSSSNNQYWCECMSMIIIIIWKWKEAAAGAPATTKKRPNSASIVFGLNK